MPWIYQGLCERLLVFQWDLHDVIKWKHFPRYWPFVWGIYLSPVNYPHKGQWRGALMFSLIRAWTNRWVNNWNAGDFRRHRAHYDVTVMQLDIIPRASFLEVGEVNIMSQKTECSEDANFVAICIGGTGGCFYDDRWWRFPVVNSCTCKYLIERNCLSCVQVWTGVRWVWGTDLPRQIKWDTYQIFQIIDHDENILFT